MDGRDVVFWNWVVAVYLFGAGVSAGAYFISSIAYFLGRERYEKVTRLGAYIAPVPVLLGTLCLVYDLERPQLFWKLLVTFQPNSVMSLGAWLLLLFSILSALHLYLWLPDGVQPGPWLAARIPGRFGRWKPLALLVSSPILDRRKWGPLRRARSWVALAGIPLCIGVGIYTGVLLGALVARPFWNNPMLPMLFLVSALKTGTAAICFAGCFVKGFGGMGQEEMRTHKFMIHSIDFILMVFSMMAVALFIFGLYVSPGASISAAGLIMGGEYTFLFWALAVGLGILIPFGLETYEMVPHFTDNAKLKPHNPWMSGAIAASVLTGGFVLRYVVVYAGQAAV